ncbi:MAG: hypothetical protein AAF555_06510 [Verrucomicrobiota bacterium]
MLQIIFNEISAREVSQLAPTEQLALLDEFQVTPEDLDRPDGERFGKVARDGADLFRFRASEYRIYFALEEETVVVHRVLNRNTLEDFFYRTKLPLGEDEALSRSKHFWKLIEEGENARKLS